ncbi:hypothetical protein [Chroogloeocystis siderophila]|jgi:DNA polymerase III delta prime subunit|uniref:Uncharacterized protein n=1 Tax=Chroogloeocystis siderophila 5.2 s.c.1 TaxID=247279 RepID=A0A1U7HYC6_9CHRO|nr:hypothetical protein [Chroogloeocystis siderophila]OKH28576.1 hypothetical protein NIES1031_04945 [Chroogloeocystis siderophila 5.2 s.c.1]
MRLDEFAQQERCSTSLPSALQALWYAKKGDWNQAHEIVQEANDADSAWVHAYLHRQEGDLSNARYWYRRSQRPESTASLSQEWQEIAGELLKMT